MIRGGRKGWRGRGDIGDRRDAYSRNKDTQKILVYCIVCGLELEIVAAATGNPPQACLK